MRGDKPAEKDRSERYLLTYSDLMNLLLILFIVLFATSKQDVVKAAAAMSAIGKGFGSNSSHVSAGNGAAGNQASGSSSPGTGLASSNSSDYSDFYSQLIGLLKARGLIDKVGITADQNEVIISLKDNVLFSPGKADLNADATSLLSNIGSLLTKISYGQVLIEGHTDSDPIHTSQFQDNRELSLVRAYNVSEVFQKAGVDPKRTLPVGYGEWWPVASNSTSSGKAMNRRVVITILRRAVTPPDQSYHAEDLLQAFENTAAGDLESSSSKSGK